MPSISMAFFSRSLVRKGPSPYSPMRNDGPGKMTLASRLARLRFLTPDGGRSNAPRGLVVIFLSAWTNRNISLAIIGIHVSSNIIRLRLIRRIRTMMCRCQCMRMSCSIPSTEGQERCRAATPRDSRLYKRTSRPRIHQSSSTCNPTKSFPSSSADSTCKDQHQHQPPISKTLSFYAVSLNGHSNATATTNTLEAK